MQSAINEQLPSTSAIFEETDLSGAIEEVESDDEWMK
jgi:hypothetical protein